MDPCETSLLKKCLQEKQRELGQQGKEGEEAKQSVVSDQK